MEGEKKGGGREGERKRGKEGRREVGNLWTDGGRNRGRGGEREQ